MVDIIRLADYIDIINTSQKDEQLRTEAYYCTGGDIVKVHGSLVLSQHLMFFEPH